MSQQWRLNLVEINDMKSDREPSFDGKYYLGNRTKYISLRGFNARALYWHTCHCLCEYSGSLEKFNIKYEIACVKCYKVHHHFILA